MACFARIWNIPVLGQHESYNSIPFILITETENADFKNRMLAHGIIDVFAKPLNAMLIKSRINGVLQLLKKQRTSMINSIYKNRHQAYTEVYQVDQFKQLATTYGLTKKEVEICKLMLHGQSYKKIASQLNVAVATIKSHLQNVSKKIDAKGRGKLSEVLLSIMN